MNRFLKVFLVVCIAALFTTTLNAQISITSQDLNIHPGLTITKEISEGDQEVDLGEAGENRVWDFTGIELEVQYREFIAEPAGKPGAENFEEANFCWYQEAPEGVWEVYVFGVVTEEYANHLGMTAYVPQMDSTFVAFFEREGNLYSFPMSYGDEWDVVQSHQFAGDLTVDSIHFHMDAWGTIRDVAGEFPCLRLQQYTKSTSYEGEDVTVETDWEYIWFAARFGEIVRISGQENEDDPNFNHGEFTRTISVEPTSAPHLANPVLPEQSGLNPAYPNPFNPRAQLGFRIANPGMVQISIYNLNGQVVSNLVNGFFVPGNYSVMFDADGLGSGVYLAKFSTGNVNQIRTLMLVK